jgi:hypothetical protein
MFICIAALPLGFWLIRNYAISGTIFGQRNPSIIPLPTNIWFTLTTLRNWFIPGTIFVSRWSLALFSFLVGALLCLTPGRTYLSIKVVFFKALSAILLIIFYTAFLIYTATSVALGSLIDNRLLSPIYVPLMIVILVLSQEFAKQFFSLPKRR